MLNCVEPRKGLYVTLFTKVHQFDLGYIDTENVTSHIMSKHPPTHSIQNTFKI